jgi:hypothetical protein
MGGGVKRKPILCLDFDGVLHSYTSGWQGADVVSDPPVPDALQFIWDAQEHFTVAIHSSRSGQSGGIAAMKAWLFNVANASRDEGPWCDDPHLGFVHQIEWPIQKPPAMVTLDDRAITFTGEWPRISDLVAFKPWNKGGGHHVRIAQLEWKSVGSTLWIGKLAEFHYSIRLVETDRYVLSIKGEDQPAVTSLQDAQDHAQNHMENTVLEELLLMPGARKRAS